ncbi:MAG: VanZ family protein [Patescibacteria group bacterium]|nr:VanZ family protein [Patescibacteria group bacterium]
MKLLARLFILFSWAVVIFIFIATPMPENAGIGISYFDKAIHVCLFGIFSYLIILVLACQNSYKLLPAIIFAFVISFLYAGFGEYLQTFIPGRSASNWDLLAGILGIIAAQFVVYTKFKKTAKLK